MESIVQFNKIDENSKEVFGTKAHNLSIVKKYANVPNGFVLSDEVMREFLEENNLISLMGRYLDNLMVDNENVIPIVNAIQKAIIGGIFSTKTKEEILEFYESLSLLGTDGAKDFLKTKSGPLVCVRNGIHSEDSIYQLNIRGIDNLIENIKILFASNFTSKKIILRKKENEDLIEGGINPVIIQKMVQSQRSGVCYSYNPNKNVSDESLVEAIYGLGIGKEDRKLLFDKYTINKDYEIIESNINIQEYAYEKDLDSDNTVKYSLSENSTKQKLNETHIKEIVQTTRKLKRIFNSELIVEFGFVKNVLMIFDVKLSNIELLDNEKVEEYSKPLFKTSLASDNEDLISEQLEIVDIETDEEDETNENSETNVLDFEINDLEELNDENNNVFEDETIIDEGLKHADETNFIEIDEEDYLEPQIEEQPFFKIDEDDEINEDTKTGFKNIQEEIFDNEEVEVLTLDDLQVEEEDFEETIIDNEELNDEDNSITHDEDLIEIENIFTKEIPKEDDFVEEENLDSEEIIQKEDENSDFGYNFINEETQKEEVNTDFFDNQKEDETIEDFEKNNENLIQDLINHNLSIQEKESIDEQEESIEEQEEATQEEEPSNNFFSDLNENDDDTFLFKEDTSDTEENIKEKFDEKIETVEEIEDLIFPVEEEINEEEEKDSSDNFFSRIEVEDDGDFIFDTEEDEDSKDKKEDLF